MLAVDKHSDQFLYRQVIDLVDELLSNGTLRPGDRLPSLRSMSERLGVSLPTVRQAYVELERRGRVEARPKSGFYVRAAPVRRLERPACTRCEPVQVRCRSLIERVSDGLYRPDLVPFGIANPCMARPVSKALHRTMKRIMARTALITEAQPLTPQAQGMISGLLLESALTASGNGMPMKNASGAISRRAESTLRGSESITSVPLSRGTIAR